MKPTPIQEKQVLVMAGTMEEANACIARLCQVCGRLRPENCRVLWRVWEMEGAERTTHVVVQVPGWDVRPYRDLSHTVESINGRFLDMYSPESFIDAYKRGTAR